MDGRHDLTVDHSRLLANGGGYTAMDNSATGHPNSQQLRPPYGDLCRPPGTDTSTLSAAYHSRYLASMPLSTGSSFPFLGSMFTGTLPAPPTSPFRAPSTPGVNNLRFWPPTPPPDGYGRYSMNANLYPLFGTPSPDNGAFLTQGLVPRLGLATNPIMDHKEHSLFSHGIGLGSPLTPTSHVTSPSPYPHLIPSLERHPAYGGHMTLGNKELEDLQHDADEARLMKNHMDCIMKHDIPSSRQDRQKSKTDSRHCCEKPSDDCCKMSPSCISRDNGRSHDELRSISKLDGKSHSRHPTNKVQPCKIEVSHSPTLKPDLLSPPIESPKSETISPCRSSKKTSVSPFSVNLSPPVTTPVTMYDGCPETRCSQCAASMKGIGIATKLNTCESKETSEPVISATSTIESFISQKSHTSVVSTLSTTVASPVSTAINPVNTNHSRVTALNDSKQCYPKSPRCSPVINVVESGDKTLPDQLLCKSNRSNSETPPAKLTNSSSTSLKHVTAAVIPTAPKQTVHREIHPETNCSSSMQDLSKNNANCEEPVIVPETNIYAERQNVKLEVIESNGLPDKIPSAQSQLPNPVCATYSSKPLSKNPSTSCKVKDMIKNSCSVKQLSTERVSDISPSKSLESDACNKTSQPNSPTVSSCLVSSVVSPTVISKSTCKSGNTPFSAIDNARKCSPFKEDHPVMKAETVSARLDCEFSQKSTSGWTKATVLPFNWQNGSGHDDQAINLTVSKKSVKPEPSEITTTQNSEISQASVKLGTESTTVSNSGVIGVCHPNPNPNPSKIKGASSVSSISNFASISVLNQPTEQATEVHIMHRSSKSSFPIVNRNATPPVSLKSTISHVTANTNIHRSLKAEKLTTKRGKLSDVDKLGHSGRATLATLAPKLSKNISFGKEVQTSHTLSAASSVSSTSIVFPATVNPCIPVGIAIAQQRQDSSAASIGKSQSSVPSSTPNVMTPNSHLAPNRVTSELQTQEIIRDQKSQDLSCSNNPTPVDTNLLVTQGPTIVSRQWESEALTRAALPSSWVTHGSIVAPAVWLGQGAYAAAPAPASNTVPSVAMNSLESSPISLPPGGYQLARDSITGHLLLIPTANIELMDRPSVWPSFNSSSGNLPIQQLVTQQQHTQFEQVIPQAESLKTTDVIDNNCNITACDTAKSEDKVEDVSGQVPSVPLATGQTYAFTTFPTQCDPSSFSYVLQSSTVMHLAHTQTTASIQTDSGRRSQGTSPLHCATPSPPPNTCSIQVSVTEDEESDNESDDVACCETTQVQTSCQSQSVTTAIQVDMDSQTNSEEDEEEERKIEIDKTEENKVEMSDSANQTESVPSESPKSDMDLEDAVSPQDEQGGKEISENLLTTTVFESTVNSDMEIPVGPGISIKEDIVHSEAGLEIVTSETELAPSLPVESKPVMDFIDHHGLNLLVDSIEEFASREQEAHHKQEDGKQTVRASAGTSSDVTKEVVNGEQIIKAETKDPDCSLSLKPYTPSYKTIDTSCTDGLGLLCALAEQRFFEEAMNVDENKAKQVHNDRDCYSFVEEMDSNSHSNVSSVKENLQQPNSDDSSLHSSGSSSPDHREATELEMRLRLAELQKKYRQKQRELELLKNKKEKENSDDDLTYLSKPSKTRKTISPVRNAAASHVKYPSGFNDDNIYSQNSISKPWQKKQNKSPEEALMNENSTCSLNVVKQCDAANDKNYLKEDQIEITDKEEKVSSIRTSHEISNSLCGDSSTSIPCSDLSNESFCKKSTCAIKKFKSENSLDSNSSMSKDEGSSQDQDYDKNDKSKTPFFDEQAWFVRRSERIFLSDARSTAAQQQQSAVTDKNKRSGSNASQKISVDVPHKEKKEHSIKSAKVHKSQDDSEVKKGKCRGLKKSKSNFPKKRSLSESCESGSSCDEEVSSSDSEHSDGASSTSENLPLSIFVEQSSSKTVMPERQKRLSTDSECSDFSSGQSEDIPLSVLIGQKSIKYPELKSCILTPDELQENARLLVLDEGLFYAGYITKSEDQDMYGILIDGERAARPHMFSKEEILNAAVLEVKPTHKQQLPEGSRICAFWSQQYRCLYPGTVTKASSPLPDPSMLYVEFDDGDSGRIALNDIRMLPPDFPIVSMEPNPFMILGKRRARAQSQNGSTVNDAKNGNEATNQKNDKEKSEHKKHKNVDKSSKKSLAEGKNSKEISKSKSKSPSTSNRSRSSSKSSCSSHSEAKNQSITGKKETSEESKKKSDMKSKHGLKQQNSESKTDDMCASVPKPKKHKKHKEDHHKHHHHHHHKHHHHKKHKAEKQERHSVDAVISSSALPSNEDSSNCLSSPTDQNTFILENSKSELTVKIKKSPSPHTAQEEAAAALVVSSSASTSKTRALSPSGCSSADDDASLEPAKKKVKKVKQQINQSKPAKRKDRMPSVEKSKIAAFLPVRQLWRWSGKSFRRPGAKGKAKKEFYRAIQRGKETIRVGDCAVFLSTGRPHLPYIGRIETMWESWGGKMDVKVKWFYHPEETKSGKKLSQIKGALFQSPHFDENDVQTISHKCEVLSWEEYQQKRHPENNYGSLFDNNDTYFLAGTYDPIMGTLILEPGVPGIPSTTSSDL